jgi:GNAT superfamily N-acetyltransferase
MSETSTSLTTTTSRPISATADSTRQLSDDESGLARRIEEASLNAWPASSQLLLDGWLVRFARGFTKRANSVVPLPADPRSPRPRIHVGDLAGKVRFCENLYARERLKTVFRITSIDPDERLDTFLAERGYRHDDATDVLYLPLEATPSASAMPELQPLELWLDIYARMTGLTAEARPLHAAILRNIVLPCCHAALGPPSEPVACGLAVLQQDLVGLFDVVTATNARRAGHGEALVAGLLDWGRRHGARTAYLQMVSDNAPAAGLYRKLGFRPLYRYWYRVSG